MIQFDKWSLGKVQAKIDHHPTGNTIFEMAATTSRIYIYIYLEVQD